MYKEDKLKEESEFLDKPTVADMLGMFLNDSSTTSQSTSPSLKTNTFSSSSSSSPIMYDEDFHQTRIRKPDIFSPLGQQYVGHRVELESTYRSSNGYSKSQPLSNAVLRDLEVSTKSKSGNLEEKGSLSKSRSGKEFPPYASAFVRRCCLYFLNIYSIFICLPPKYLYLLVCLLVWCLFLLL